MGRDLKERVGESCLPPETWYREAGEPNSDRHRLLSHKAGVGNLLCPTGCMILGKRLGRAAAAFPGLRNGDGDSTWLAGVRSHT